MKSNRNPKRRALPARELQVSERLRESRDRLRLSQSEFAAQVGINRQRLASYEEGRAPLRFDLALRICRQFIISEQWLATGEGDARAVMDLGAERLVSRIPADTSFAKAYDDYLGERYSQLVIENDGSLRLSIHPGDNFPYIKNLFLFMVERWSSLLREDEIAIFLMQLINVGVEIVRVRVQTGKLPDLKNVIDENGDEYIAGLSEPATKKERLTKAATTVSGSDMQGKWPALKRQLQAATEKTSKSELAKFLKVDLTRVSQWLTDAKSQREPGAEYALQMQDWLRRQQT